MDRIEYIQHWAKTHPENRKRINERYRKRHPDKIKIKQFLYGHSCGTKRGNKHLIYWGLLNGDGWCIICGEFYPFFLEQHHLFRESETQTTLCANHHSAFHRTGRITLEDYVREILV